MDQDFSDLWEEKKEVVERCKMFEQELNQREFNNERQGGNGEINELALENS